MRLRAIGPGECSHGSGLEHRFTKVTLLWGEELFLGWIIAGCFRPRWLAEYFQLQLR